jgi:hypothetical protein
MQDIEHHAWPTITPAKRRGDGSRFRFRRGWVALGVVFALACVSTGGYLAYQNAQPTAVALNLSNGQKEVPTDFQLKLTFTRPVPPDTLAKQLSVTPSTDARLVTDSSQKTYAWVPSKPLADLTAYTLTIAPFTDSNKHQFRGGRWTFTTTIVPRITAVNLPDGTPVKGGIEIEPMSKLTFVFNDPMKADTVKITLNTQPATLTWATDVKSASVTTSGIPSGPLVLALAAGAKDSAGRAVREAWTLDTGLYYRDGEHTVALKYPALIQVPNDEFAVDQDGLQAADIVFEYLAEGGITRLTAAFDNAPDLIGPMRSSRLVSLKIARHYKGLLFQSGESAVTQAAAGTDPVPQFFDTIGYTFRTDTRDAPDNLMISGANVNRAERTFPNLATFVIPKARPSMPAGGDGSRVVVSEHYSTYTYDPIFGTYQKDELGHNYRDAHTGLPLRIEMLVVLHTQESLLPIGDGHGSYIHDFNLDGSGKADIFYKGQGYAATWAATDHNGPLTFSYNGQALTLPPGLVWIDVTA